MPNWCSNSGYITGEASVIKEIWDIIHQGSDEVGGHDERPAITALRPCPAELTQTMAGFRSDDHPEYAEWKAKQEANIEKYGYENWYGWSIDNWGTKWTPDFEFDLEKNGESIHFMGDSAWSPPDELMRYITEIYPVKIEMSYIEEGMGFMGYSIFDKGFIYNAGGEPEISYDDYTDEDGEIDWDAYNDEQEKLRDEFEREAFALYEANKPELPRTTLLGRDILPLMEKMATVSSTLAGEVVVAFPELSDTDSK